MAENSEISWCDHTWNAWWGCVKVSALCDHCYAETWTNRYGGDFTNRRRFIKSASGAALKWDAEARKTGVRKRVFCMSMGDIFEALPDGHPDKIEMDHKRMHAFELMDTTDALDWLVLTKRICNVKKMVPRRWLNSWPSHVRLGISVGTQKDADRDIPRLFEIDCPNFLSMEPLLERVDVSAYLVRIDWLITGGESGPHARPSHPEWFRLLRDQCQEAGVPFHFKQWGEWVGANLHADSESSRYLYLQNENVVDFDNMEEEEYDKQRARLNAITHHWTSSSTWCDPITIYRSIVSLRVGKKAAGHLLDGVEHFAFPDASRMARRAAGDLFTSEGTVQS